MADQPEVSVRLITPGYFKSMRIPLVRGRDFTDADGPSAPKVVVVSESFAKRFWPDQDPIGRRLTLTFFPASVRQVVGVVGDVKIGGVTETEPSPTLYWPFTQVYAPERFGKFRGFRFTLAVRTLRDPEAAAAEIRTVINELSPNTPLGKVQTMEERLADSIAPRRFNMLLLVTFAGLALLLAAVGIYSVLAYAVRQRVHEIGVRMALGADLQDVLRMVVIEGMRPALLGVAIGAVASIELTSLLSSLIYGVRATDAATFVGVSLLLSGVAFAASILPAYAATKVDPLQMLRDE
jgi:predicted permease